MKIRQTLLLAVVLATTAITASCNLTGGIDSSKGHDEMLNDALTKLDNHDCNSALTLLNAITPQDDPVLEMTGKAMLCNAGAPMDKVLAALAGYNASQNNLNVLGNLANAIVPVPAGADSTIGSAYQQFQSMSQANPLERGLWMIYADLVRVAALMAKDSASQTAVYRSDISASSCLNTTCSNLASDTTNCTVTNMSTTDAGNAANYLSDAVNIATTLQLGSVNSLLGSISSTLGSNFTAPPTLCLLYNQALTQ